MYLWIGKVGLLFGGIKYDIKKGYCVFDVWFVEWFMIVVLFVWFFGLYGWCFDMCYVEVG